MMKAIAPKKIAGYQFSLIALLSILCSLSIAKTYGKYSLMTKGIVQVSDSKEEPSPNKKSNGERQFSWGIPNHLKTTLVAQPKRKKVSDHYSIEISQIELRGNFF